MAAAHGTETDRTGGDEDGQVRTVRRCTREQFNVETAGIKLIARQKYQIAGAFGNVHATVLRLSAGRASLADTHFAVPENSGGRLFDFTLRLARQNHLHSSEVAIHLRQHTKFHV